MKCCISVRKLTCCSRRSKTYICNVFLHFFFLIDSRISIAAVSKASLNYYFFIVVFMNMRPFVYHLCTDTTSPCLRLFTGHRLGSSRLWTHLTVGGSEWPPVSVSCHPICPPLRWNQLLRGSGRWQQTAELPRAFKWWESAERQSQQVTRQVIWQWVCLRVQVSKNITEVTRKLDNMFECVILVENSTLHRAKSVIRGHYHYF